MTASVQERVDKGVALLDLTSPNTWWRNVQPDILEMHSLDLCVLGQNWGSFHNGMYELFEVDGDLYDGVQIARAHGFEATLELGEFEGDMDEFFAAQAEEYEALRQAWVAVLDERRKALRSR